ncbi:hypothetical protein ACFUVV_25665 [Streptomyces sp. NPDC057376]|uniref:hypothetical protein n=1 Tax=unclassified Streptomyces TaxID=2593676 RepID=UPI00093EC701|nr:hypothetical protein [Streptomyces sp. CB02414]OKI74942.1 hypothetical protein AMK11_35375 [Streptomyces sp. CB02414]
MIATEVKNRFITETRAQRIADRWNAAYPAMRAILDTVIKAQRGAEQPTVDVARLERVRREMGQQDRGSFKACTRSPGGFSIFDAFSQVREVVNVTSIGHADAGAILRLCAELADAVAEAGVASRAERAAVPAQPVDGGRRERADSEQTEGDTR